MIDDLEEGIVPGETSASAKHGIRFVPLTREVRAFSPLVSVLELAFEEASCLGVGLEYLTRLVNFVLEPMDLLLVIKF